MKTSINVKWLLMGLLSSVIGVAVLAAGARHPRGTGPTSDSSRSLTSNNQTSPVSSKVAAPGGSQQPPSIPTHIIYGILFREIRELNKQADKLDNRGARMDALREHRWLTKKERGLH